LPIKEGDSLLILADLGNGWLSARKHPITDGDNGGDDNGGGSTGLVPENYVQRI
jgi:hypothetical protein